MPRRRWTSTDQLEWLQPWVSGFNKAQESKEFSPFFRELNKEWFKKYPLDQLKSQELGEKIKGLEEAEAAGNTEKAEMIRESWWQQVSVLGHDMQPFQANIHSRDYIIGSITIHVQGLLMMINGQF
jgi:hypothetical protein